jgi:hypothetical protein
MKSFDLSKILNKITFWIDKSEIKTWTWHYWLFYYMIIPAFVLSIPLIIQYVGSFPGQQMPPYDIVNQTFVLNIYHPTIISMFLANYTHLEIVHLCYNLLYYLASISIIFFLEKNKGLFVKASAFFFIFLPFLFSVLYLCSTNAITTTGYGFSGIVFAFLGYVIYLICKRLCENDLNGVQEVWSTYSQNKKTRYLIFFFLNIGFILLCIPMMSAVIFITAGSVGSSVVHFAGYLCGLLIPIIFLIHNNKQVKFFEMTLLIQIFVIMGFYSMYLIKIRQ